MLKKILSFFLLFFILFSSIRVNAGWLDIPENIDANGLINQFINQYTPLENTDYENNIKELLKIFKKKEISKEVKDSFTNALVANIHSKLNNDFSKSYGYAKLKFTPQEEKILKELNLYDALSNFQYIELDYDFLKESNVLEGDSYNYFKNNLYPLLNKELGFPNKKESGVPYITSVGNFTALVIPKKFKNLRIFFEDYYSQIKGRVIPFGIPGNNLVFVSIPKKSNFKGEIISNLLLDNSEAEYLIQGKIKYPKELKSCMDKIDGNNINTISDLSTALKNVPECKSLLNPISLDCDGEPEFIGNFNQGTLNQFVGIYGLEDKNDFLWIVIIKREFQRKLLYALPSSSYNSTSKCGYNLLMSDNLTLNKEGYKNYNKGTKKIIYSSRNSAQGWNSSSHCSIDSGTLKCDSASNNLADATDLYTFTDDLINEGQDFGINIGVYQTGSLDQNLLIGLKDSSDNIINYWAIGKNIGNGAIDKGIDTQNDLGINFNNYKSVGGVNTNIYWNNYLSVWGNLDGSKEFSHNIRNSQVYDYKVTGNNSGNFENSLVDTSLYHSIGGAGFYNKDNFNRGKKLFVFSSGSNLNDISQLSFLDLGINTETKYYIFSKKETTDGVQTLNLQQTLNLEGFGYFMNDIGLTDYNTGDGLTGYKFSFSGTLNQDNIKYAGDPKKDATNKIDFDVLRYNYGTLANGLGTYKEIKHFKLVYDNTKDMYIFKDSDVAPFTAVETSGVNIGGILGPILKDCSLVNFITDDLEGCSHGKVKPINIDNDTLNIGNGYIDPWNEWIYIDGDELRIFNNIVQKNSLGNYEVKMEEVFYNNKLQYCAKENQEISYYKNHNSDATALIVNSGGRNYKGYSSDYTKGISLIFKQGDYKFIYGLDGTNWMDKKYNLTQLIEDSDNTITCE